VYGVEALQNIVYQVSLIDLIHYQRLDWLWVTMQNFVAVVARQGAVLLCSYPRCIQNHSCTACSRGFPARIQDISKIVHVLVLKSPSIPVFYLLSPRRYRFSLARNLDQTHMNSHVMTSKAMNQVRLQITQRLHRIADRTMIRRPLAIDILDAEVLQKAARKQAIKLIAAHDGRNIKDLFLERAAQIRVLVLVLLALAPARRRDARRDEADRELLEERQRRSHLEVRAALLLLAQVEGVVEVGEGHARDGAPQARVRVLDEDVGGVVQVACVGHDKGCLSDPGKHFFEPLCYAVVVPAQAVEESWFFG
jgi:hypothetical protein